MSETPQDARFVDDARRYQLESRIATGGMGEVWRARDTTLGRTVAVKLLKTEYADDASFRARFETEARNAAVLHHPNVASVFDFGESTEVSGRAGGDGSGVPRPYLVMELVDGRPLSELIRPDSPMDPGAMRGLLAQAADAIGAAHAAGIVHRDVKPANLLVTPDRRVKITDFGIARATEGMALTQTGQVMGTPQYLSPEQAQGSTATPASDVYSLGVVAFECLTGRRPFDASSPVATALAHVREPVPELPDDVPADLAAVVRKTMAKAPEDRFADGAELAAALRDPATAATAIAGAVGDGGRTSVMPAAAAGAGLGAAAGAAGAAAASGRGGDTGALDTGDAQGAGGPGTTSTTTTTTREDDKPRRRTPAWLWAVLLVALAVIVVLLVTQLGGGDEEPTQEPTTAPSQTRQTPSQEPTQEEPETVEVDEDDYLGRDVDEAAADLSSLGLEVARQQVGNPGDEDEDTVSAVNPTGTLEQGERVTLSFYGPQPEEEPEEPEETEEPEEEPSSPTPSVPTPSRGASSSPTAQQPSPTPTPAPSGSPSSSSLRSGADEDG